MLAARLTSTREKISLNWKINKKVVKRTKAIKTKVARKKFLGRNRPLRWKLVKVSFSCTYSVEVEEGKYEWSVLRSVAHGSQAVTNGDKVFLC